MDAPSGELAEDVVDLIFYIQRPSKLVRMADR